MCEVKSFQPDTQINQQVPQALARSPLPLDHSSLSSTSTHGIQDTPRLASSTHWSLTSSMQGLLGSHGALILSSCKWNSSINWNPVLAKEDLLTFYQRRGAVGATLHALGLDPERLPTELDPNYQHMQATDTSAQHDDHQQVMMALIRGEEPPCALSRNKQQACPPSGLVSSLPSASSSLPASVARPLTYQILQDPLPCLARVQWNP